MTNQGNIIESIKTKLGLTDLSLGYESALFALFRSAGVTNTEFNGAYIEYLQLALGSSKTNITDLLAEYSQLFFDGNVNSINDISKTVFTSSWKTDNAGTSTSTQITIPTVSSGTYASTVDWGDGSIESSLNTFNDARWTHTYSSAGTYVVKISGDFAGWSFANGGDKLKFLDVLQVGVFDHGNEDGAFYGCSNLTSITASDKPLFSSSSTSIASFFRDCGFTSLDWSIYNFSSTTSAANFLSGVVLTQSNFNTLLSNLESLIDDLQDSVAIHFGSGVYSIGDPATTIYNLTSDKSWSISSGGPAIPNLIFWIDGHDSSTITESSSVISAWDDKSLEDYNISTGSATYDVTDPTKPVAQFNGTSDFFERDTPTEIKNWTSARTIIMVVKVPATPVGFLWDIGVSGSAFRDEFLYFNGSNEIVFKCEHSTTPNRIITGDQPSSGFHIFTVQIDSSANSRAVELFQDNISLGSFASMGTSNMDPNKFTIGVDPDGGGYLVRGDYTNAGISEFMIYDRLITTDELSIIHTELNTKWGIS